jgi:hypothetical protein
VVIAYQQDMIIWSQLQCVELGRHVTEKFEGQCQNAEGSFASSLVLYGGMKCADHMTRKWALEGQEPRVVVARFDAKLLGSRFVVRSSPFQPPS